MDSEANYGAAAVLILCGTGTLVAAAQHTFAVGLSSRTGIVIRLMLCCLAISNIALACASMRPVHKFPFIVCAIVFAGATVAIALVQLMVRVWNGMPPV
jgi:hypothetical protein